MALIKVSFHRMEPSPAIEALVREQASRLERFYPRIVRCNVDIERPHRHLRAGAPFHVRIRLTLPGHEISVTHQPSLHAELEAGESGVVSKASRVDAAFADPALAIRDAFNSAIRRLQDDVRRLQGAVKVHETPTTACVTRLFPDDDYGFLETPDGREVYFHANSVLDGGFAALAIGDAVRFVEEAGDEGPQASTVAPIASHRK